MDSKRTHAVYAVRFAGRIAVLGLVTAVAACEDTPSVTAPVPPPQIPVTQTYSKGSTGLPNSDVYAMLTLSDTLLTSSDGEFWIGTEQGIARYASVSATVRIGDDVQIVAVSRPVAPGGVVVESGANGQLETKPQGDDLVFFTDEVSIVDGGNGVAETAKNNISVINELNGLPNPKVRDMAEFDGKVYVATWGGGFAIYDMAADTWTSRTVVDGLRHGAIADIEVSPTEGRIYFATTDAVSIYDPGLDTFTEFIDLTRKVTSAVEVRDTPAGVERWYGPRVEALGGGPRIPAGITVSRGPSTVFTYTEENSGLPDPDINAIYFDDDESLFWVAFSTQGVSAVNIGYDTPAPEDSLSTWTNYTTAQGLPSNTVYSVTRAASPEGGSTIWVATQNGVARLKSNGTWQGYSSSGGLSSDRVRRVYSDDGQRLWAGYITGGAAKLKPASAQ